MGLSRLRVLFYFAAFLLGLSVCYLYAQDAFLATTAVSTPFSVPCTDHSTPVSASASSAHLLLWTSPQHVSFLQPDLGTQLSSAYQPAAPVGHIASRALLSEVEAVSHNHRRLLHIGRSKNRMDAKNTAKGESAVLELISHQVQSTVSSENR